MKAKRFKFALEGLLKKRKMEQDQAIRELSVVLARYNEQESTRQEAFRLLREETGLFEKRYREEFELDLFQMYDKYLERLEAEAADAERKMENMKPELDREREKVMIARRNKRIIEMLKERYKKQYDQELGRLEKKELFEINSSKAAQEMKYGQSGTTEERRRPVKEPDVEMEYTEKQPDDPLSEYFRKHGIKDPRQSHSNR